MSIKVPIDTYALAVARYGRAFFNWPSGSETVSWQARIICRAKGPLGSWTIFLFFTDGPEVSSLNARTTLGPDRYRAFLFLPRSAYADCVDMLRNEKPVYLSWSDERPQEAMLLTGDEPVGEGEDNLAIGAVQPAPPAEARSYAPLQEHTMSHSLVNGYLLAVASRDVYGQGGPASTGSVFREWFVARYTPWMTLAGGGLPLFDMISDTSLLGNTGVQAMIMSNERFVILTFRGTQVPSDDPGDWLTNVAFAGTPVPAPWAPGVLFHNGWLTAADRIYPELVRLLTNHMSTGKPLWICGHSLGGVLAVITALHLHVAGDAVVQGVATIGAPPAGGGLLPMVYTTHDLHRRTRRWVNDRDIAPQLPLAGYLTVGTETFIDQNGDITPDAPWTPPTIPSIAHHAITTYCNRIRARLDTQTAALVPL